jgi:hypothetical protein
MFQHRNVAIQYIMPQLLGYNNTCTSELHSSPWMYLIGSPTGMDFLMGIVVVTLLSRIVIS